MRPMQLEEQAAQEAALQPVAGLTSDIKRRVLHAKLSFPSSVFLSIRLKVRALVRGREVPWRPPRGWWRW